MSLYNVKPRASIPAGYRKLFKGENFMTPNRVGWFKLRVGFAELSEGEGMSRQTIYGVTVRPDKWEDGQQGLSRLFQSKAAAMDYIELLSEEV